MTTPQDNVQQQLKAAMKAGDKPRVATLRMLLTAIKNDQINSGQPVDDERFLSLVGKAVKQRKEAAEAFRKGDRIELAEKEEQEAEILEAYLPTQASEEDVRSAIATFIAEHGLEGPAALGQVMKAMMAHFGASSDGKTISRIARELLTAGS
ncbi:MAG: GatB/YqeY domain-containing protein [Acidobacteriota bacterium]